MWILDLAKPMGLEQPCLLHIQLSLDRVELGDDVEVLADVRGADGVRALEHHVLEEMRDSGDAGTFVDRPHSSDPPGRDIRIAGTGYQQDLESVLELVLDDRNFLGQHRVDAYYAYDQRQEPAMKIAHEYLCRFTSRLDQPPRGVSHTPATTPTLNARASIATSDAPE